MVKYNDMQKQYEFRSLTLFLNKQKYGIMEFIMFIMIGSIKDFQSKEVLFIYAHLLLQWILHWFDIDF